MIKKISGLMLTAGFLPGLVTADLVPNERLYGYIYWENGLPITDLSRRSDSLANEEMAEEPDLIIQTGYYNLRIDNDDIDLTGFDASDGSDYISALYEDVTTFSDGALLIRAYKDGVAYTARSAIVEDDDDGLEVRLIEQGQFVQRFDHMGLVFTDSDGNELGESGYLEVTAWPDRVVFTLDFSDSEDIERTTIQVTSPDGTKHLKDAYSQKINLAIKPQDDETLSALTASSYITAAYDASTEADLDVEFDTDEYAFRIDFEPSNPSYPSDIDVYDEYVIELTNPTDEQANIPLVFNETQVRGITGTVMTLVEDDGRPTGHPVQISKNWHKDSDYEVNHEGSWLRGSTMVTLDANSSKTLRLRVIQGYWDQVGAVSHAQLSLIGYSDTCWQWDESAVGSWGESMTFDPSEAIAGAFMADVRPAWTTPMSGDSDHNWTENIGGGEFLIYYDENGDFRWTKSLKTAYRWTGPNMTEVLYSGYTDDDAIRFTYTTQLVRSNDYHRRFQQYNYEILEDINPTRLAYYQMAAEYYNNPEFDTFYRGNASGLLSTVSPDHGGDEYTGSYYFKNRWLAIADTYGGSNEAMAYRGLIHRSATLNDASLTTYVHTYGNTWGDDTTLFDISAVSTSQSYSAGDVIHGEIEFVLPAQSSDNYWGYDDNFSERLADYSTPWEAVKDEYAYNSLAVEVANGTLVKDYPVTIDASDSTVLAKFTIAANEGIGHIPVIIQNAEAGLELRSQYQLEDSDSWEWAVESSSNIGDNAFYQGYLNADGTMDYVFNINRPADSLDQDMTIRVFKAQ
jgi:hypothetical protein